MIKDIELDRLVNSVLTNATDDSDASWDLVLELESYYYDRFSETREYYDEFLGALKSSAEHGCDLARAKFCQVVCDFGGVSKEVKRLAVQYGKACDLRLGLFHAAKILENPEFRPCDYFFNENAWPFGMHMLNEPDYDLLDAANCFQEFCDFYDYESMREEFESDKSFVLEAYYKAAILYLNKRGFGPGIPIEDNWISMAIYDLECIGEKGSCEQAAIALSIKGLYFLEVGLPDCVSLGYSDPPELFAADCFVEALDKDPNALDYFYKTSGFKNNSKELQRVIEACEKSINDTRTLWPEITEKLERELKIFKQHN